MSKFVARHMKEVLMENAPSIQVDPKKHELLCVPAGVADLDDKCDQKFGSEAVLKLCDLLQTTFLEMDKTMVTPAAHQELRYLQSVIDEERTRVMKENNINPSAQQPLIRALLEGKRKIDMHEEDGKKYITLSAVEDDDEANNSPDDFGKDDEFEGAVNDEGSSSQSWDPDGCGCTAVVALHVHGDEPCLIVANAGDSRAVLSRQGVAVTLTKDHKPMQAREMARIRAAGGVVSCGRVDGNLNLSRSLGDLFYKKDEHLHPSLQRICAYPDVTVVPLQKGDDFVILACDGIWDCQTNQQAVDFVRQKLQEYSTAEPDTPKEAILARICEEMCDLCLAESPFDSEGGVGCDNMTMMIFLLDVHNDDVRDAKHVFFYGTAEEGDAYAKVSLDAEPQEES